MAAGAAARRIGQAAEAVALALAVLAPWAFGSVEAWAELGIVAGVALLTLLGVLRDALGGAPGLPPARRLRCGPSVALAGLAGLALLQASPLPGGLLARLDPPAARRLATLAPPGAEAVADGRGVPVPPPPEALGQDRDAARQSAARLACAWLLFQGVLGLGGDGASRRCGRVLAGNAVLLALVALVQSLTWEGATLWWRPSPGRTAWSGGGPFVCHTHLAEVLNLGLGAALGVLLAGGARARPWAAYASGVIVTGIVTSHSRGGFLGMLAGAGMAVALARSGGPGRRGRPSWLVPGLAGALGLLALLLAVVGDASPYRARLATILDTTDRGYTGRFAVWGVALRTWAEHPLFGTGLGSFPVATAPGFERALRTFFARAENEPIDLLAEGGLVGLGLGLAGVAGVVRLGRRARASAVAPGDRAFATGAAAGLFALAVQLGSDFGMHVPGVAVPAVILVGHLARRGLRAGAAAGAGVAVIPARRGGLVLGMAGLVLAVGLVANAARNARFEAALAAGGVPAPGVAQPTLADPPGTAAELSRMVRALEAAVRLRPGWAEGHLRLGLAHRGLYRLEAAAVLSGRAPAGEVAVLADPLHLLGLAVAPDGPPPAALLEHDAIRRHLAPAAAAFLAARRACPVLAAAHGGLAEVSYLLAREPDPAVHAARALGLSGNDGALVGRLGVLAAEVGDLELASRSWARYWRIDPPGAGWAAVAEAAFARLPPDRVLALAPDAATILRLAGRIPEGPDRASWCALYCQESLDRLAAQPVGAPADRLALEARARAGLDERDAAERLMAGALRLDPSRPERRAELIGWLRGWGQPARARDQARLWLRLAPDDARARRAWDEAAEATARGPEAAGRSERRPPPPGGG
jgi:hypothetical protein